MTPQQREIVLESLDNLDKLNEWENDFIGSMADLDDRFPDKELTPKQDAALKRINKKLEG